ncbi:MAG: hypothetical protein U0T82_12035 [Bacteroidales bacterium]
MFRGIIPLFYSLFTIILGVIFLDGEVTVKVNAPAQVDAGTVFRVEMILTKSQLTGFSRFAQDIPAGLTASSLSSANADFTFEENRVRLIWLKLPDSDTVLVSYSVRVDERLKGTFTLGGRFSYIEENQRKSVEVPPRQITIIPSPTVDPRLIVDVKDFREKTIPNLAGSSNARVACIRQKPDLTYAQGGIVVTLLVNKEKLEKFAKIEENVPPGYSAIAVEKKDAIFTFRDQTVKFLWMTLPPESWFTVSYKLVPTAGNQVEELQLNGVFSYIDGKKTNSMEIIEQDVSFDALNQAGVEKLLASLGKFQSADTSRNGTSNLTDIGNPVKNGKTPDTGTQNVKALDNNLNTHLANSGKNVNQGKYSPDQIRKEQERNERSVMAYSLEPENGIYYRVQVAAGHQPVNIKKYFRKNNFHEQVRTEKHEGWYKYSIGSWNQYREARDFRVQLWNTTTSRDAFVAAYNNGKRITVQEALMVSNQKWYQ